MHLVLTATLGVCAFSTPVLCFGPWAHYQTEPTFRSSVFDIRYRSQEPATAPGYIFITNYVSDRPRPSFGPQIYTMDGDLVWNGNDTATARALDAHVCDYRGQRGTHLCMNDAIPHEQPGHSSGVIRFLDSSYEQVGSVFGAQGDLREPDNHELNTPRLGNRQTFLQDIYQPRQWNLSKYRGHEKGFILDGCFQEINQASRKVEFQWCALDHVEIDETAVYLNGNGENYTTPIAGDGSRGRPWDWFHINAIDKNEEGDYLVSGRHADTIYKIAGKHNKQKFRPGEIVWRLGGKQNDFAMDSFSFSRQHDVRFYMTSESETVISLFNNAYDGFASTAKWSEGQLISLNTRKMTARVLRRYESPDHRQSLSQGSVQFLRDYDKVFVGWGNRPMVSEHDTNGTLLYWASFSGHVESFRAWKFPWLGTPKTKPKILGYSLDTTSPLYAYISWNGATEVAAWSLYTSTETARGPWRAVGRVPKMGFETFVNFTHIASTGVESSGRILFRPFVYAEALDAFGAVIGTSHVAETFVPDQTTKEAYCCGELMCERCSNMSSIECDNAKEWFAYDFLHSQAWMGERSHKAGVVTLSFLVFAVSVFELAFMICWGSGRLPNRQVRPSTYPSMMFVREMAEVGGHTAQAWPHKVTDGGLGGSGALRKWKSATSIREEAAWPLLV